MALVLLLLVACSTAEPETAAAPLTAETEEEAPIQEADHDDEHDSEEEHEDEHESGAEDHDDEHKDEDEEEHEHEDEDEHREHGAHEHGVAALTIAWSGNDLAVDLQTPAYNVLGFEHAPSSDEEQALLDESVEALEVGDLLQFSAAADCALVSAVVETELADKDHEDEHEEEEHEEAEEVHSDIDVAYNFQCQQPDQLTTLDVGPLFERFPNFEDLDVQWVSDTQQSAAELTPDNTVLSFE